MKNKLSINLDDIPDMKCHCGLGLFLQVCRLKYISPLHCDDPGGRSAQIPMWSCLVCGQLYDGAKSEAEIKKIKEEVLKKTDADKNCWKCVGG